MTPSRCEASGYPQATPTIPGGPLRRVPGLLPPLVLALCAIVPAPASSGLAAQGAPWTEHTLRVDPASPGPAAAIADVAWLAGHWAGTGLGGGAEEVWMPPRAGRMVGAFTLVQQGAPVFHELMAVVEEAGSLVLRIKHFHPDLTGWEPADSVVTFPLARIAPDTAWFDGLTLVRESPDRVRVYLVITSRATGEAREEVFEYSRVR